MDSELLKEGISIAITGYIIVFVALTFLYFFFYMIPKIFEINTKKKLKKAGNECADVEKFKVDGDVIAAISATIYKFISEKHDKESYELTIKQITKKYSPWNSKIYTVFNLPRR